MYTAIVHDDGTFDLSLHRPPAALSREEARRSLALFEEALGPLRRRAAAGARAGGLVARSESPPLAARPGPTPGARA